GVAPVLVGDNVALRAGRCANRGYFGSADRQTLRIGDRAGKRGGINLCHAGERAAQDQQRNNRPLTHTHSAQHTSSSLDPFSLVEPEKSSATPSGCGRSPRCLDRRDQIYGFYCNSAPLSTENLTPLSRRPIPDSESAGNFPPVIQHPRRITWKQATRCENGP